MQFQTLDRYTVVQAWLKGLCVSKRKISGQTKQMRKSVKKVLKVRKLNTVKPLLSSLMPLGATSIHTREPWSTMHCPLSAPVGSPIGVSIWISKLGTFCNPFFWSMLGVPNWVSNWCHSINRLLLGSPGPIEISDWDPLSWSVIGVPSWGASPLWSLNCCPQ